MPEENERIAVWVSGEVIGDSERKITIEKLQQVQKHLLERDGLHLTLPQVGRYLMYLGHAHRMRNNEYAVASGEQ